MFKRILVANRGEIAVRIIRACRELDIESVAVYSEADREALHVKYADYSYPVGPAPSTESYLRIDRIIDAARKSRADAVHPGYGFLAENAEFAHACAEAGIVFLGPSPEVIKQMGDKVNARALMKKARLPVIPGSDDILSSEEEVLETAAAIGYPCVLKAVAGGGGKGLRLVESSDEIRSAYRAARSEAASSFGDSRLYVEKYLERCRHIEVQLLADIYGKVLHLYTRECSIQRRHQKIIEECPPPTIDLRMQKLMGKTAAQGARALGYTGVGTMEFLVDRHKNFYFLEMNTRLQVEHAITERVMGIDLVKAQINVAAGAPLPWSQRQIRPTGHAIECRIYAEDPETDFMPCPGKIEGLRLPEGFGIRNDCGVYEGGDIPIHYDPMIAKLIVWGEERAEAIRRLKRALREYQVRGVKTNIPFHQWMLRHPQFIEGDVYTGFVDEQRGFMAMEQVYPDRHVALASAAIVALHREQERALRMVEKGAAEKSEWREAGRREALQLHSGASSPRNGW